MTPFSITDTRNHVCADEFDVPLPAELREHAARLSWGGFVAVYGRCSGPLRLAGWSCLDGNRSSRRWYRQGRTYQATISVGERTGVCVAAAQGPLAALTEMLHKRGIAMEILGFHQLGHGAETATFVHGSNGRNAAWAMGCAAEPDRSAVDAVIACANRLLAG